MVQSSSDLFAACAEVGQNGIDPVLVDGAHGVGGNAQLHPAVLAGDPEPALVQVGHEAAAGLVHGMRDVVAGRRSLAGDLAYSGHYAPRSVLVSPLARETAAPAGAPISWSGAGRRLPRNAGGGAARMGSESRVRSPVRA